MYFHHRHGAARNAAARDDIERHGRCRGRAGERRPGTRRSAPATTFAFVNAHEGVSDATPLAASTATESKSRRGLMRISTLAVAPVRSTLKRTPNSLLVGTDAPAAPMASSTDRPVAIATARRRGSEARTLNASDMLVTPKSPSPRRLLPRDAPALLGRWGGWLRTGRRFRGKLPVRHAAVADHGHHALPPGRRPIARWRRCPP